MTHTFPGPNGALVRQNAIRVPAAFHCGENSLLPGVAVSWSTPVPSGFTVYTSTWVWSPAGSSWPNAIRPFDPGNAARAGEPRPSTTSEPAAANANRERWRMSRHSAHPRPAGQDSPDPGEGPDNGFPTGRACFGVGSPGRGQAGVPEMGRSRSEEHTSELQS